MAWRSPLKIVGLFVGWALAHSALASRRVKGWTERLVGPRYRNGLYRATYNLLALATVGGFIGWFVRLPDRELYRIRAPYSWPFYAGQSAAVALLISTLRTADFRRVSGLASLGSLLVGASPEREPEAQGPTLGADGELRVVGPFRYTRHPENLPVLGLWLFPRMTVNLATLAALATAYGLLGSLHEDARLRAAYGEAFERYRRRYPFFWPRLVGRDGD